MKNQNLNAVVMPNGSIQLEWTESSKSINKSRLLLQKELYKRFISDTDSWLLFLGFSGPEVSLSESLDFWREFARLFAWKLSRTPDLERRREQVDIAITTEETERHLEQAPLRQQFL